MKRSRMWAMTAAVVAGAGLNLVGPAASAFAVPPANPTTGNCANATAAAAIRHHFPIVDTAASGGNPDGRISHNDLVAAGNFLNGFPLDVANASNHILRTPNLETQFDVAAHGGLADNNISDNDLRHVIVQEIWQRLNVEDILDEIGDTLNSNSPEFVRDYCQKGGA